MSETNRDVAAGGDAAGIVSAGAGTAATTAVRAPQGARHAALAMAVICTAQFVLQLDFSIVNVALPTIQRDLHMAPADLQWIATSYALTFGSLLLAGGRMADMLGRRRLLAAGLVLFGLASLGAGLAVSSVMLIVCRFVQGAAGALVSPAALSLLTTANPDGAARNRALSIWQAATAAGATAGVLGGGVLTQYLGWRAIFLVNPPLIVLLIALVPSLPATPAAGRGAARIDVRGALLITAAIAALIFGLSDGQQHGFASVTSAVTLALAALLAAAFVRTEMTVPAPMVPPRLLAVRTRRTAVAAMAIISGSVAAYVYFVSLYLQRVAGLSPLQTGLSFLPSTLTVIITSTFVTRRLLARFSVRQVLITGLVALAAGQVWLGQLAPGSGYAAGVVPGLVLTAFGMGLALPTGSVAITAGVPAGDLGLAGAMFTTSQQTGAAVGLAVLATAAAARTAHAAGPVAAALSAGYRLAYLIGAGFAAVAILIVLASGRPRGNGTG